mmetsp:Transcript_22052/g.49696  ORF Transcript_22052/g.49696 Transcript_22052/m.49696 type:complete len:248 (-) Transcript_22052:607-1350(-)
MQGCVAVKPWAVDIQLDLAHTKLVPQYLGVARLRSRIHVLPKLQPPDIRGQQHRIPNSRQHQMHQHKSIVVHQKIVERHRHRGRIAGPVRRLDRNVLHRQQAEPYDAHQLQESHHHHALRDAARCQNETGLVHELGQISKDHGHPDEQVGLGVLLPSTESEEHTNHVAIVQENSQLGYPELGLRSQHHQPHAYSNQAEAHLARAEQEMDHPLPTARLQLGHEGCGGPVVHLHETKAGGHERQPSAGL